MNDRKYARTRAELACVCAASAALAGSAAAAPADSAAAAAAPTPGSLCASAQQVADVRRLMSQPRANYWTVAGKAGTSEAAVLSAMAADRGAATTGEGFVQVWASLRAWPEAVSIVMKDGHVFEVHGRIAEGEPSKQSRYYNLKGHDGLAGHLRPDLVAGIYAVELPGRTGPEYGVAFADARGSVSFAVYVPAGDEFTPEGLAAWQATKSLIARLPALCPAP